MSLFDDVKKNLMEWYAVSSDKTTEVARITTRRYDKFGISRDIERQFSELGSLIYNGMKEERQDLLAFPAVHTLLERIKGLEDELRVKNEEIQDIQDEFSQRRAHTAAAGNVSETILTQPVLDEGGEDSAILVEPVVVDVEEPAAAEAVGEQKAEESDPEKEG
ncbi:MAG: hypothetical protein KAH56_06945 [Candidatus Krumholzibacteria bacterium]|nr:hypothetical protein [Candidatus Krumholzibacteria bacterium]